MADSAPVETKLFGKWSFEEVEVRARVISSSCSSSALLLPRASHLIRRRRRFWMLWWPLGLVLGPPEIRGGRSSRQHRH